MRPVNGSPGTGGQDLSGNDKKTAKRDADKARKNRRDVDSSDESQPEERSAKGGKFVPKMKSNPSSRKNDKEVRVAPNSTTYSDQASTAPGFRPSSKRDAFQDKVRREKEVGTQGRHRQREDDLRGKHPELTALRLAQLKKDWENARPKLDPAKLLEQAKSAGGHLDVQVTEKKNAKVLASVLQANPAIHSLRLNINLGGPSGVLGLDPNLTLIPAMGEEELDVPDTDTFRSILQGCKHIQSLNLSGCRLTNEDWLALAWYLDVLTGIKRLELGGGDHLSSDGAIVFGSSIGSENSSLKELVIDGLFTNSLRNLLHRIYQHGQFTLIKLENIGSQAVSFETWDIDSIFHLCRSNPKLKYLSMAGTRSVETFPANDEIFVRAFEEFSDVKVSPSKSIALRRHDSLRVLDLSDCGLSFHEMAQLAKSAEANVSLLDIRVEGNEVLDADRAKLNAVSTRNRKALEKRVDAAFALLISHAASQIDTWPPELIGVLIENTPPEVLLDIAAVIGPTGDLPARSPDTTGAQSQPANSGSPKPQ